MSHCPLNPFEIISFHFVTCTCILYRITDERIVWFWPCKFEPIKYKIILLTNSSLFNQPFLSPFKHDLFKSIYCQWMQCTIWCVWKACNNAAAILITVIWFFKLDDDMTHVNKNLSKKQRNIWYEARLLSGNGDNGEKAKKVYVYISPKVRPENWLWIYCKTTLICLEEISTTLLSNTCQSFILVPHILDRLNLIKLIN